MLRSRKRTGFTESPSVVIPEVHCDHLQRARASHHMAWEGRELLDDMVRAEEEADEKTAWTMDYLTGTGITVGECWDI